MLKQVSIDVQQRYLFFDVFLRSSRSPFQAMHTMKVPGKVPEKERVEIAQLSAGYAIRAHVRQVSLPFS